MIEAISVSGLGPHEDTTIQLGSGVTRIEGPSECGKTSLIDAMIFALHGRTAAGSRFPVEWIRDGVDRIDVSLQLEGGRRIERTLSREREMVRLLDGDPVRSEAALGSALGRLGDHALAQLVLVPLAWTALARGNARPLRDLLLRILPAADPAAQVEAEIVAAGHVLLDPAEARMNEKQVMSMRREARKERDEAMGRKTAFEERVAALQSLIPSDPRQVDATAQAHNAWLEHDRQLERYDAHRKSIREASGRAEAWDLRNDELGPEPEGVDLPAATAEARQHAAALAAARDTWRELEVRSKAAMEHAASFDPAGVCPVCGNDDWAHGAEVAAKARRDADVLGAELKTLGAAGLAARQRAEEADAALTLAREADAAHRAWRKARSALGSRPRVLAPLPLPNPPSVPRPQAEALEGHEARIRRQAEFEEALRVHHVAGEAHRLLSQEADRLDVLLQCVRAAPSAVAERQREVLGDLGPVALTFGDDPAVTVQIDGRPWWVASRGRLVVADLWLRAALRRAWGIGVPLFVDNVQDVAGQALPEVEGPLVLLKTVEGAGLEVG